MLRYIVKCHNCDEILIDKRVFFDKDESIDFAMKMKILSILTVFCLCAIVLQGCGEGEGLFSACAYKEGDVVEKTATLERNTTYAIKHVRAEDRCGEIISIQLISARNYKAANYTREVTLEIKIAEVITAYSYIGFVID